MAQGTVNALYWRVQCSKMGTEKQYKFYKSSPVVKLWANMSEPYRQQINNMKYKKHESGFIKWANVFLQCSINATLKKIYEAGKITKEHYAYLVKFPL